MVHFWEHILMFLNIYVMKSLKDRSNRMAGMKAVSLNVVGTYTTIFSRHTELLVYSLHMLLLIKITNFLSSYQLIASLREVFLLQIIVILLVTKFLVSKNPKISFSFHRRLAHVGTVLFSLCCSLSLRLS